MTQKKKPIEIKLDDIDYVIAISDLKNLPLTAHSLQIFTERERQEKELNHRIKIDVKINKVLDKK